MEKIVYLEKRDADELPADASEQERIDAAVRWINRKVQSTVHFGLIQVGYYLLNTFFGGDIDLALSRNPHKQHSFRKLCLRPDLIISSTHLVSAVKLVVQEKQLQDDPVFAALPVSHKIALLGVRDLQVRRALARRTASESLSVRALNREVRRARGTATGAGDLWARGLRRALGTVLDRLAQPMPEGVSAAELAALDRALSETRQKLQSTLASVRGIRSVAV